MKDIILHIGDRKIPAVLNDTVAAKDFETRLPFHTAGYDSGIDYCCTAKEGKVIQMSVRQDGKTAILIWRVDGLRCCMPERKDLRLMRI